MDVTKLAELVDEMIVQHDYPGFEPRSLKLGLPESVTKAPAKVFSEALGHPSVYVKLAALRWFQERPGMMKSHLRAVAGLIDSVDPYVRLETVRTLEKYPYPDKVLAAKVSERLLDESIEVRRAAAKACGKICSRVKPVDEQIIERLQKTSLEQDSILRGKAEKALRKIGLYD